MNYTAIIIEPRKNKTLEFVLNNMCDCLSNEWKIILFHGIHNIEYCNVIAEKLNKQYNNRIQLVNLNIDNLTLTEYSILLSTKSIVYDYIGSPWEITDYFPTKNCDFIGNGGFSLRRKSKMFEIMDKIPYYNTYEDLYFSTNYENVIVNKPEYNLAKTFCVDEVYCENTFACHKPWVHNHYQLFKQVYPEVEELRLLQ